MAVFLIESGANINLRARNGETALMIAISQGDNALPLVHSLLEHGADLTIQNNSGSTALDYARSTPEKPKVLGLLQQRLKK